MKRIFLSGMIFFAAANAAFAQDSDDKAKAAAKEAASDAMSASMSPDDLIRAHHEGDVAMGVCGARLTALQWFYQESIAAGRDDLKPLLEPVMAGREIIKGEAERRATEDGVDTSVRVMNQQIDELWNGLVNAAELQDDGAAFQAAYNELVEGKDECFAVFFSAKAE